MGGLCLATLDNLQEIGHYLIEFLLLLHAFTVNRDHVRTLEGLWDGAREVRRLVDPVVQVELIFLTSYTVSIILIPEISLVFFICGIDLSSDEV